MVSVLSMGPAVLQMEFLCTRSVKLHYFNYSIYMTLFLGLFSEAAERRHNGEIKLYCQ